MIKYFFQIIIFSIFIASCTDSYYNETKNLEKGWKKNQLQKFEFSTASNSYFDVNLIVRNHNNYPYRNLWVFVMLDGKKDTLQYLLADKEGNWLGNGALKTKEIYFNLYQDKILKAGKHTLILQHAMRTDTLKGLADISIEINKK